jgi:hypothetical protein
VSGLVAAISHRPDTADLVHGCLDVLDATPGCEQAAAPRGAGTDLAWGAGDFCVGVRGPDSLVDLATEPEDGRAAVAGVTVAFYGELLNTAELVRELEVRSGDRAAVALAAYRRWGSGFFARLEGVHAIVVVDPHRGLVLAGVDPRSICWLVAAEIEDSIVFATAARALRAWPGFVTRLDPEGLTDALTIGYPVWGHSLFAGARGLQAGTHFEAGAAGLRVVRHADDRDRLEERLRGDRYLTRLVDAARAVVAEAAGDGRALLPLTGGLDSRMLAAALPAGRRPTAVTFGVHGDDDVVAAARIAEVRALDHVVVPFEPDYVLQHAVATAGGSDGCQNPANNLTGCLLCDGDSPRVYLSGFGGEAGRGFLRSLMRVPDTELLASTSGELERLFLERFYHPLFSAEELGLLLGPDGGAVAAAGRERVVASLHAREGLPAADCIDLYSMEVEYWEERPALNASCDRVWARAPFHTERWVAAMLSGAPEERRDDLVRLKLIRALDARVAAVPWTLTHLPLRASEVFVRGARAAGSVPGASRLLARASVEDGGERPLVRRLKQTVYRRGERRDTWLRGTTRDYLEDVLLGERCRTRGLLRPAGIEAVLADHMSGHDRSKALGQLLGLELWQRLFVDGDVDGDQR